MPNWGPEIPVKIVGRKPDFVGDYDVCAIYQRDIWLNHNNAGGWAWHRGITKIKLLADHPYYTKDKPMIISEAAAKEALRRSKYNCDELMIANVLDGSLGLTFELAKVIQRLWDLCPSERPVDNRVIAMRHAWVVDNNMRDEAVESFMRGDYDFLITKALATFDAKLAELEGGQDAL